MEKSKTKINNQNKEFQSDISKTIVQKPTVMETTALGAAYLAGLATGYWEDLADIKSNFLIDEEYSPNMSDDNRNHLLDTWQKAVDRAKKWASIP